MEDLPRSDWRDSELPRWVQVPVGLMLALFTLFCAFASLSLLQSPHKKNPIFVVTVAVVLLLGCLWVLEKCFRMVAGSKKPGGLLSPRTLSLLSYICLALPLVAVFTGYYREYRAAIIVQAVVHALIFLKLRSVARQREAKLAQEIGSISTLPMSTSDFDG